MLFQYFVLLQKWILKFCGPKNPPYKWDFSKKILVHVYIEWVYIQLADNISI